MTTVSFALGSPRAAASRGGDCRAFDIDQDRNVHGKHRFSATTHCQITNGMIRLTVGAAAAAPSLTVEAYRGRVVENDFYTDLYSDLYSGNMSLPEWLDMGTLTIDSPSVSALLTAVRIVRITPHKLTIRLLAPVMADAYVTLKRGERQVHIQHGRTRGVLVDTDRRIRWTDSPSPTGVAAVGRVEESPPATESFPRYVGSLDPVTTNAGAFSITAVSATTARMGAGVGTDATGDRPVDMHHQLADASRVRLVVV